MAITATKVGKIFKNIGKMIYLSQLSPPAAFALKKSSMGCVDQVHEGDASEFDTFNDVMVPLVAQVRGVVKTLEAVPSQIKSSLQAYLQKSVAVDLGLAAGAAVSAVGTGLVASMNANGQTVAPSGENWSNEDGYAVYFAREFGITLPQSDTPNILDEWIDDDVVA